MAYGGGLARGGGYGGIMGGGMYDPRRQGGVYGGGMSPIQEVQGGSLKTWSFQSAWVPQVEVWLSSEGRPLDADVELWNGPDNTPVKCKVYSDDGEIRPFRAVLATPQANGNTVSIRNTAQLEFPMFANVEGGMVTQPSPDAVYDGTTVQGGALRTFPVDQEFESMQVLLRTDGGRPLNARVEVLQGPNNNKQVIELYADDGIDRPIFIILETPGPGNVIRIVNTSPVEFPMTASIVPNMMGPGRMGGLSQMEGRNYGGGYGGFGGGYGGGGYGRGYGGGYGGGYGMGGGYR
jgi:hypothetical protein